MILEVGCTVGGFLVLRVNFVLVRVGESSFLFSPFLFEIMCSALVSHQFCKLGLYVVEIHFLLSY